MHRDRAVQSRSKARVRPVAAALAVGLVFSTPASAQGVTRTSGQPMSAIGWLNQPALEWIPGQSVALPPGASPAALPPGEPPVTRGILVPTVDVQPLGSTQIAAGLVPPNVSGLPRDLWVGSRPQDLVDLLSRVQVRHSPALQRLLYTLLLTEAYPPQASGPENTVLTERMVRLMDLGAADPVRALADLSEPTRAGDLDTDGSEAALKGLRDRFRLRFDAALLTGGEEQACTILTDLPRLSDDYRAQIFCAALLGDWDTAALIYDMAETLSLLDQADLQLLGRFLHPDLAEEENLLPPPTRPDPLTFHIYSAIGERLPTGHLPRVFANADLDDIAGWKAQIEAAERLTRSGALSPNQLLGLYTAQMPSASGGVWDRAEAVQRFDVALSAHDGAAVAAALPRVWEALTAEGLGVPFATLFAHRLAEIRLPAIAGAQTLAWQVQLLSPDYELAARTPPDNQPMTAFLAALAQGKPQTVPAPDARTRAIARGFAASGEALAQLVPEATRAQLSSGRLGEAILQAMIRFTAGLNGDTSALTESLATFRAVGLEDTARRAALQALILKRT
ncbi:hypothetical protein [Chachezhania sediminis]|uniref:hypothetical protein n=1 Tax=Chachezhania sediminis TaxID=2599291 RepID=UPI00131C1093|nr:hypothetical protein [Chachezhania sediminis]